MTAPTFEKEGVLPEYPRPQMRRESYFSLNGEWDYAITRTAEQPDKYDGKIVVPYSPESPLSGVNRQLQKDEFLHYGLHFTLPEGFYSGTDRVLLHFGACDQICKAKLNGHALGGNKGGYLPFSFDITPYLLDGDNFLSVVVTDDADSDIYGRGKQRYQKGGIWYTAISGIWQTVWLERVPERYITQLKLTPNFDEKTLTVRAFVNTGSAKIAVKVLGGDKIISEKSGTGEVVLDVSACKPWTPASPKLYPLEIICGEDRVTSYFGLRKFSTVERNHYKLFALNNEPIFESGLLDQGYWGEGIYTPKSNFEMYDCLQKVKAAGFNMLRKHIKVEPLLWYYYCDVLGILVWQDMLNGGKKYKQRRINLGPFVNLHLNDKNYRSMGRDNPASRAQYLKEAHGMMDNLYNCVSVCLFTPFNEGWGQFDAVDITNELKKRDPSRLFDHASGWQDKGGGDVYSRHIYFRKVKLKNDKKRVLALTEFGGYAFSEEKPKKSFGYKKIKSAKQFDEALLVLYLRQVYPAIKEGLCATVYTQLCDVEEERNGLFTSDFTPKLPLTKYYELNLLLQRIFQKTYCNKDETVLK